MVTDQKGARKKKRSSGSSPKNRRSAPEGDTARTPASANKTAEPESGRRSTDYQRPAKTHYWVKFFNEWCKSCGICVALCPQDIIELGESGYPQVEDMDECTGCRNCEIHCPDFAITVKKRHPERRKSDGTR